MKSAFVAVVVLILANVAFAQECDRIPVYTSYLNLSCQGEELKFNWPDYENVNHFYGCQGDGRPRKMTCKPDNYFSFVMQTCQNCDEYIPSQGCETLKLSKGSSCLPINAGTTTTTKAPTTTTTKGSAATKTKDPTTTTTKTITTTTPQGPTSTLFPPAPSPNTVDPDVPTPPTAPPTPPSVEEKPPSVEIPSN